MAHLAFPHAFPQGWERQVRHHCRPLDGVHVPVQAQRYILAYDKPCYLTV